MTAILYFAFFCVQEMAGLFFFPFFFFITQGVVRMADGRGSQLVGSWFSFACFLLSKLHFLSLFDRVRVSILAGGKQGSKQVSKQASSSIRVASS